MKLLLTSVFALFISLSVFAQENGRFYAMMALGDAEELKADFPNEVDILQTKQNEAVVHMTQKAGHELHERVLMHGPGYIFKASLEDALESLLEDKARPQRVLLPFTITEDIWVYDAMNAISTQNIEDHIMELEDYGTRFHNRAAATQAATELKAKWEAMAATYGRTDVSVRLFTHQNTPMPSVIMTIEGSEFPDEYVVVGGHLDSTSNQGNNDAPGADDDASGIATITEATRALFEVNFVPKRTIEVMAYAAEEIGLVGSAEIADEYDDNSVNVISAVQFDMTNYNGSANDVSFVTDFTDATLNSYLMQLLDHYNTTAPHQVSYGTSVCNYGCSDHASWTNEGYMAAFPFEANFGQHNPNIHTPNDTYSGTADHATKFAKLCAEYLIETSKGEDKLSVSEFPNNEYTLFVNNRVLLYEVLNNASALKSISVYDISGKEVVSTNVHDNKGTLSLAKYADGVYVVSFQLANNKTISKKVILK